MRPELADALTLGGTCEYNIKQRYKSETDDRLRKGEVIGVSGNSSEIPLHYDHSYLHYLNELASSKSLPPIFENVRVPVKNNGEVFLSKYFHEEMTRIKLCAQESVYKKVCSCKSCQNFLTPKDNTSLQQVPHPQIDPMISVRAPFNPPSQIHLRVPP